ncbi:TPA: 4'-phosphopantetheinyl transferase superfamily protein [Bacillus thuringiensis]|nr:4'-phosphopantetheinyl transferase superfamily protein [Bacillus thuringiensis]
MLKLFLVDTTIIKNKSRKALSDLSTQLVKSLISKESNQRTIDLIIRADEYGKKAIKNDKGIHFSVSYTEEWLLIGLSCKSLGVDIEKIRSIDYKGISNYFSYDEQSFLEATDSRNGEKEFFRIWTAKESYMKYLGKGLSIPLDSFTVPLRGENYIKVNSRVKPKILSFTVNTQYMVSICYEG